MGRLAGFAAWFRNQGRKMQLGMGCGALIVMCSCCGALAALGGGNTSTAAGTTTSNQHVQAYHPTVTPTNDWLHIVPSKSTAAAAPSPTATATPKPTLTATTPPVPPTALPTATPIPCTDAGCNPWGYSFEGGSVITNPPSDFCAYFSCIASFWNGTGYVVQCANSDYSLSGGHTGACSKQGGVARTLYQH